MINLSDLNTLASKTQKTSWRRDILAMLAGILVGCIFTGVWNLAYNKGALAEKNTREAIVSAKTEPTSDILPRAAGTEMAPESNWNPTLLYTLNRLALLHQVIPEEAMIISVGEKIEGGVVPVLITREKGDTYSCFARTPGAFSFLTRNTLRAGNTGTMLTVLEPGVTEFRHPKSCFFIPN